jgi:hypothetical protein
MCGLMQKCASPAREAARSSDFPISFHNTNHPTQPHHHQHTHTQETTLAGANCENCSSLFLAIRGSRGGCGAVGRAAGGGAGRGRGGGRGGGDDGLAAVCAHGRIDQTPGRARGLGKKTLAPFFHRKKHRTWDSVCTAVPCAWEAAVDGRSHR